MSNIDWNDIDHFVHTEFPEDPNKYADPVLIHSLDDFRIECGFKIYPSPAKGGLARLSGSPTSQHYVVGRKSTAIDIFVEGKAIETFTDLLNTKLFNGIGIYLDTRISYGKPWVMFHVDIRTKGYNDHKPLIWIVETYPDIYGEDTKYTYYRYPQVENKYWSLLQDKRMYIHNKRGA